MNGRDWRNDFANTVFQMTFVLMLIGMAFLNYPLRRALLWRFAQPLAQASAKLQALTAFYGVLSFVFTVLYITDAEVFIQGTSEKAGALVAQSALLLADFCTMSFLIMLAMTLGTTPWLNYVILVWVYIPRLIQPFPEVGFFHLVKMYTFGQLMCKYSFKHAGMLKNVLFRAYWPFAFAIILLLTIPSSDGRCDKYPRENWLDRARYYIAEGIVVVWFCSGAMNSGDPWKIVPVLNQWALFAYVTHEAINRLVPHPYGAFTVFAMVPVFLLLRGGGRSSQRGGLKAPNVQNFHLNEDEWLGLVVQDISGEITAVQPGGWGDRQGLQVGDKVLQCECGIERQNFMELPDEMQRHLRRRVVTIHKSSTSPPGGFIMYFPEIHNFLRLREKGRGDSPDNGGGMATGKVGR